MSYDATKGVCLGCLVAPTWEDYNKPNRGWFCDGCEETMTRQEKRQTIRLVDKMRDEADKARGGSNR